MNFVKVYSGFFEGSLRDTPPYARLLFLAMISKADSEGVAFGSNSFWTAYVGIDPEQVAEALAILSAPDLDSSSDEEDGRRIVAKGKNRWVIVNYRKYLELGRREQRKVEQKEWDQSNRPSGHARAKKSETQTEPTSLAEVNPNETQAPIIEESDTVRHSPTQSDDGPTKSDPKTKTKTETREEKSPSGDEKNAGYGGREPPRLVDHWPDFVSAFPKRSGDSKRGKAEPIFRRLVNSGVRADEILAGVRRYAEWCRATGKWGSELVQQMPTWLNAKAWNEPFEIPDDCHVRGSPPGIVAQVEHAKLDIRRRFRVEESDY